MRPTRRLRGKTMPQLKEFTKTVSAQVAKTLGNLNQKALREFTSFMSRPVLCRKVRFIR
jgi:hypothetical protein